MNELKPISDFVVFNTKGITPDYVARSSIMVLNQKCIRNNRIDYSFAQFTDDKKKIPVNKFVKKGDILVNSTGEGTAGRCAFVSDIPKNHRLIVDSHILILRCNSYFEAQCLSYILFSFESSLQSFLVGSSGQAELDKVILLNIRTSMTTNSIIQKKIVLALSVFDVKIELNYRIIAELEAIAKTLYDYWFVQFDFPDENGKPYKSSGGKMVWNEKLKREIPEGWRVENIERCCQIVDCLHSKKPDYYFEDDKYYLLQLENLLENGLIDVSSKYYVSSSDYSEWTSRIEVRENDILITNAGRVASTAQVPKEIISGIGRNITAIRPVTVKPTYLFLTFRGYDMSRQIKWNTDLGSFFSSFNVKGIKNVYVLRPPDKIEGDFESKVYTLRRKRELQLTENQTLSELRDWILPMLMNGQVKVN